MSAICEDADGAELRAGLSGSGKLMILPVERMVAIEACDLDAVVRGLYEAAGKEPPLILSQPPAGDLLSGPCSDAVSVTPSPARGAGNLPGVMLQVGPDEAYSAVRLIGHEPMRVAGALINAMREAEREPDPDQVEELAALIRRDIHSDSGKPSEADRSAARTALRWMRESGRG